MVCCLQNLIHVLITFPGLMETGDPFGTSQKDASSTFQTWSIQRQGGSLFMTVQLERFVMQERLFIPVQVAIHSGIASNFWIRLKSLSAFSRKHFPLSKHCSSLITLQPTIPSPLMPWKHSRWTSPTAASRDVNETQSFPCQTQSPSIAVRNRRWH